MMAKFVSAAWFLDGLDALIPAAKSASTRPLSAAAYTKAANRHRAFWLL